MSTLKEDIRLTEPNESAGLQGVEEIEMPLFINGDETYAPEVEQRDAETSENDTSDLTHGRNEKNIYYDFRAVAANVPATLDINKSYTFPSIHQVTVDNQGNISFEGQVTITNEIVGVPNSKKVNWYRLYCKRRKVTIGPTSKLSTKSIKFPSPGKYRQIVTTHFKGYGKTVEGKEFEVK